MKETMIIILAIMFFIDFYMWLNKYLKPLVIDLKVITLKALFLNSYFIFCVLSLIVMGFILSN